MPDRGSPLPGSPTVLPQEASWDIRTVDPSDNIVAQYKDPSTFEVPVIAFIRLREEDNQRELNPVWVAAVLDELTGHIYSPVKDSNFVKFIVRADPRKVEISGTVNTT